jgi:hypothetical protein
MYIHLIKKASADDQGHVMTNQIDRVPNGDRLLLWCDGGLDLAQLDRFPCNADKTPALQRSWKTFAGKHDWSTWKLVGVPTGSANGFDVVDIDPKNGGDQWYRENFDAIPLTQCHETRSGGIHLFFRPAGVKLKSRIAPGVDIKSTGGYIIWWEREGLPIEDWPICEWPNWLLEEARHKTQRVEGASVRPAPLLVQSASASAEARFLHLDPCAYRDFDDWMRILRIAKSVGIPKETFHGARPTPPMPPPAMRFSAFGPPSPAFKQSPPEWLCGRRRSVQKIEL